MEDSRPMYIFPPISDYNQLPSPADLDSLCSNITCIWQHQTSLESDLLCLLSNVTHQMWHVSLVICAGLLFNTSITRLGLHGHFFVLSLGCTICPTSALIDWAEHFFTSHFWAGAELDSLHWCFTGLIVKQIDVVEGSLSLSVLSSIVQRRCRKEPERNKNLM